MKTKVFLLLACGLAAFSVSYPSQAGLQIPYTPDADTLHLWHFDGAATNLDGTQNVLTPDAVAAGSITVTNTGLPTSGPPYTNISLGNISFTGLSNALRQTSRNAFANGGTFADASPFMDTNTGAFTFEAVIRPDANPLAPPNNMAIVYGDNNGGLATRGWQFRINTSGRLEFNFLANNLGGGNFDYSVPLPGSGPNAALAGQWYHVAVTYQGTNNPILSFYWTLLDSGATQANLIGTVTAVDTAGSGAVASLGGAPTLGIGGSGRTISGVGNGEGFIGAIDEVRISDIARAATDMAFSSTGGGDVAPQFTIQPATNVFIGYGQTLTLTALASGTPPPAYQWLMDGTNLPGMTENQLVISNVTFAMAGTYAALATNSAGSDTSTVAQVTIGATFSELFNTGVDTNGQLMDVSAPGTPDPHYVLTDSADAASYSTVPYLTAIAWSDAGPVSPNGLFFANGPASSWIGPQENAGQAIGRYVYRTSFLIDSADPGTAVLNGIWWLNTAGVDILLNGKSTGIANSTDTPEKFSTPFTITNGFVAGVNTLEFVVTNATGDFTGLRVEMSGLGQALPPGKPVIQTEPADQTVRDASYGSGDSASFSVVALGRPPLSYQWWADGAPLAGATNRTLTFYNPYTGGQGTHFSVVVSNDSGSTTSTTATLTLVPSNQPPVVGAFDFTVVSNTPLNIDIATLLASVSDPDHDPIQWYGASGGTNGTLAESDPILTYTPNTDYVGPDQFTYSVFDGYSTSTGVVNINVVPFILSRPSISSVAVSGGNLVFAGTGGSAGQSFTILSTTNLATPLANWTSTGTGTFDASGHFSVTNAIAPSEHQRFYLLQVP